ncbi:MAG: AbrB/MazE/SpoVT family DNA-binding domain-containing protein [Chloroflexi bacterium]|nr:AbrB/MazE/SpoVT family DNA-binding domain-containing protein [Chloroflexota bacterium]
MISVKVSSRHQIAVPSEARKALGIKAGDRLSVEIVGDSMVIKPRQLAGTRLFGKYKGYWGEDPVAWVRALRDELERELP